MSVRFGVSDGVRGTVRIINAIIGAGCGAGLLLGFTCSPPNTAPSVPEISGPSLGVVGVPVEFMVTSSDPEEDSVAFQFDWDDGDTSNWTNFIASGATTAVSHAFTDSTTYSVKAKAKDKKGQESGWSAGHALRFISAGPAYPDSICDSLYLGTSSARCSMSRDGSLVAVGSSSSRDSVSILRVSDRTLLPRVRVDTSVAAVVFSNDNQYVYAGSWNSHAVYRVDVANRRVVDTLPGVGDACGLLLTPDGNRLLVGASQYVFVVRADSLSILDSLLLPYNARCMALNQAGTNLYVGVLHGLCTVDVQGCSLLAFSQAVDIPTHVVLSPDEESLYVHSGVDSGVTVLRTSDLSVTRRVNMGIFVAGHMVLTPDGAYLYIGNGWNGTRICDTRTLLPVDSVGLPGLGGLVIHPSGDSAYYASGGSRLFVIGKRH